METRFLNRVSEIGNCLKPLIKSQSLICSSLRGWYQRIKLVEDFLPADNEQHIHNWSPSAMNDENIQAVLRGHWPAQTRQWNLQNYFPTLLATKISLSYTDTVYTVAIYLISISIRISDGCIYTSWSTCTAVHVCCYLGLLELRYSIY